MSAMLPLAALLAAMCTPGDGQRINAVAACWWSNNCMGVKCKGVQRGGDLRCPETGSGDGPFRVIPDHIEHCPPKTFKEEQAFWKFRAYRDRRNIDVWYYNGEYTLHFNFDDLYHVEMDFASWSSRGGWKDNALVLKFRRICATGKNYLPQLWKIIMDAVRDDNNQTRPDCPFPPGHYTLNNAKADLGTAKQFPAFFYGPWRLDFKIVDSNWDCVSCMRIFIKIVPLTSHGSQFGAGGKQDAQNTSMRPT